MADWHTSQTHTYTHVDETILEVMKHVIFDLVIQRGDLGRVELVALLVVEAGDQALPSVLDLTCQ